MNRLDHINELLRHEDIEGLISMGAPNDEYESEAEMIADRLGEAELKAAHRRITRGETEKIIREIWREMFDLSDEQLRQRQAAFEAIATRLLP